MSKLSRVEQRKLAHEVRLLVGKNYSDEEICDKLEIQPHVLREYKDRILQADRARFDGLDKYSVFSDYVSKSNNMIKELDEVKLKFRNRGQWGALVAAIKQKKDIYDSVIKLGQEFGFIDKKNAELKVTGEFGMSFSTMTPDEVNAQIREEVKRLHKIAAGNVVEMRSELVDVAGQTVETFVPANLMTLPPAEKKPKKAKVSTKTKVRVTLKKRV